MNVKQYCDLMYKISDVAVAHKQTDVDLDAAFQRIKSLEKRVIKQNAQIQELQKQMAFLYTLIKR